MVKTILYLTLIILLTLIGCNEAENANKPGITTQQWHYENGRLMKEQQYLNDSIEHGTYRYFYPSGILKDSAQITHNKFHGKRFLYHENGELHAIISYFNNKERNGKKYRRDGSLESYKAFTYSKDLVFIVRYDSLGKMKSYEGNPIHSWVQEKEYPIGKEFSVELLVADPPNSRTEVIISDWDIEKGQALNQKTHTPDKFNRVRYSRKQNPEEDMYVLHVAHLQDTVTRTTLHDTLVIKVAKDGKSSNTRGFPPAVASL